MVQRGHARNRLLRELFSAPAGISVVHARTAIRTRSPAPAVRAGAGATAKQSAVIAPGARAAAQVAGLPMLRDQLRKAKELLVQLLTSRRQFKLLLQVTTEQLNLRLQALA